MDTLDYESTCGVNYKSAIFHRVYCEEDWDLTANGRLYYRWGVDLFPVTILQISNNFKNDLHYLLNAVVIAKSLFKLSISALAFYSSSWCCHR